ncbi:IclR family transcriptional regulator [Nocardioides alcanivorans]|uniref:IclR family transcriptional regulator n=1 Tax=Nocardioides alcanivorans TaxID=2897352 RepID=UPI001F43749D|nr:IclR family transcriptional regulator [Nocardioides alcanivorans]
MAVKTLGTLSRGLRIVEVMATHQPVGLSDLARLMSEDKSAVQRTLATLDDEGWIRPTSDTPRRWELTNKMLMVASTALTTAPLPVRARTLMGTLRNTTGETAYFAMLEGTAVVVVDVAEGNQAVRTAVRPGQSLPVTSSAVGHALFAHLDAGQRAEFAVDPSAFLSDEDYSEIRARGWSLSEGFVRQGTTSLAAAVRDRSGHPVGAVVVSGPDTRITPEKYAEIGAHVRDAASELGGRPPSS